MGDINYLASELRYRPANSIVVSLAHDSYFSLEINSEFSNRHISSGFWTALGGAVFSVRRMEQSQL